MAPPTPKGPYSPVVRAGDWIVTAGQVGIDDGGKLARGGIQAETRQALRNIEAVLATAGAALTDVVKTTVFLKHIDDWPAMNEVYVEVFGDHRPARSAFAVAALPAGALVEVEAWAYQGA